QAEEKRMIKQEEKSIEELLAEEQAARINSLFQDHNPLKFFISLDGDDDDYDNESIISTNTDIFETPSSIVINTSPPILPIEDHDDSLIMGNEELNTFPEKESDKFIKSSVEDLISIISESEDTSRSESVCILPSFDDFSSIDIPKEKSMTSLTLFSIQMTILFLVMTNRYPMRTFRKTMLKFIQTLFSNLITC
nr:hypothetical protein [Tanacetum cinerariifolium]